MRTVPFLVVLLNCVWAQEARDPNFNYIRVNPLLSALDANHDGTISGNEIADAPAALRLLDKDHDGQLTADEVRPVFSRGRGEGREATGPTARELQETLMAFDRNKDGKLSREELPERMQGMFDRGDADKDGFLTPAEIVKLAGEQAPPDDRFGRGEGRGRGRGMRADPVFLALDTDHDGVISADEISRATAALRALDKNGDGQLTEDEVRPSFGGRGRRPQ